MGEQTAIEWTDATWNPVTGCTKVSAGCDNCYAAAFARRRLKHTYLARRPRGHANRYWARSNWTSKAFIG